MAERILSNPDNNNLKAQTLDHDIPAPREIPQEEVVLKRVARPLRHVKYIPVKSLAFFSKNNPPRFSYETRIKTPVPKDKLVVQVRNAALNPVDLKIMNSYTHNMNREVGLGREYSGVITEVGGDLHSEWKEGDEVYGVFFHPNLGYGTVQSSILVSPAQDVILRKPSNISFQAASGTLFCLGTAFNILDSLESKGQLNESTNVLINGGTTSVAMFAIQLLKYHYRIPKKLVVLCSEYGATLLKSHFPDLCDELIFVNYVMNARRIYKPLEDMINNRETISYEAESGQPISSPYDQGKFNLILDFVGGYQLVSHSSSLLKKNGAYVTTVGDYRANYAKDVFNSWDNPSANVRKVFGRILWTFDYTHFYFDPNAKYAKNDWPAKCAELVESEVVKCVVDKVYDWKDFTQALDYLKQGHCHGKVILDIEKF
ncbi:Ast1p [Lachancea thermotolerans CBS 6340]|uniref:KLTH0C06666p n=1 Tax=Lachancea thermotolerans (strain ATCC 56472 / CBS 6340 / NRRL Y-8284) TaxID=559295 RepID=C5DE66_LACTC|nr:KLTH0C06666p [Lachancea thermotolerans CBS 6340]CAR22077.1 KLTH0C06666p [Lachancea thermotolerans CBS 6340]